MDQETRILLVKILELQRSCFERISNLYLAMTDSEKAQQIEGIEQSSQEIAALLKQLLG